MVQLRENSTSLRECVFGMLLNRYVASFSKLTHLCPMCLFPKPSQSHFVGRCVNLDATWRSFWTLCGGGDYTLPVRFLGIPVYI